MFISAYRNDILLELKTFNNKMNCELMLTYDIPALRQTGSRNLTGQKTFSRYGVPI